MSKKMDAAEMLRILKEKNSLESVDNDERKLQEDIKYLETEVTEKRNKLNELQLVNWATRTAEQSDHLHAARYVTILKSKISTKKFKKGVNNGVFGPNF